MVGVIICVVFLWCSRRITVFSGSLNQWSIRSWPQFLFLLLLFFFFLTTLWSLTTGALWLSFVHRVHILAPLVTTTGFILKGLSGSASPEQTDFLKTVDQNFRLWSLFSLLMGLSCEIGSSFSPTSSRRGYEPITIVGSNKENILLSVCLRQIASAYISIFPKLLWSCQEHGPAEGKTERETAWMQNAWQARQGDTAGSMGTWKAAPLHQD